MATSDFAILTVENTDGVLALKRKNAAEVVPEAASPVYGSAAGNPAVLPDAAGERVMRSVVVNIEPAQAGAGDPAPDNVRPISGWTGAKIVRCGRNLAELHNDTNPDASKYTYSRLDGGNITFVKNTSANGFFAKFVFPAVKGTTYRFAFDFLMAGGEAYSLSVYIYKDELRGEGIANFAFSSTREWTATESGLLTVGLYGLGVWGSGVQITMNGFRIGLAAEADKGYAGYEGNIYSVAFPSEAGTVYGGTLDLTAGTLTVDRAARTLGSMSWITTSTTHRFNSNTLRNIVKAPGSNSAVADGLICSAYKAISSNAAGSIASGSGVSVSETMVTSVRDENYTDADTWIAAMGEKMLVYPLATPVVYQLTPVQIEALAGENVVSADCGAVSVEYVRDTGAVIDAGDADTRAMIGEASGETASRSLAVGEYVTVGAKLYRVTAAVGQGETLVPGTNVVETTVGAELVRLAGMINQ